MGGLLYLGVKKGNFSRKSSLIYYVGYADLDANYLVLQLRRKLNVIYHCTRHRNGMCILLSKCFDLSSLQCFRQEWRYLKNWSSLSDRLQSKRLSCKITYP